MSRRLVLTFALVLGLAIVSLAQGSSSRSAWASWYGPGFYGHGMACGGHLQPSTNGVAHRSMRCGTRLTVCYAGRCRATIVVDRGPYVAGREFDLAAGLATSLRFSGVQRIGWAYR